MKKLVVITVFIFCMLLAYILGAITTTLDFKAREAELKRISVKALQTAKEATNTVKECTAFLLEIENDLRAEVKRP